MAAISANFAGVALVQKSAPLSPDMKGQEADAVIIAPGAPPLGVFLGTSEESALHALVAKMEAEKYRSIEGAVVLLIERSKQNPIREGTLGLALARLDAVLSFRDSGDETMQRLSKMVGLNSIGGKFQ